MNSSSICSCDDGNCTALGGCPVCVEVAAVDLYAGSTFCSDRAPLQQNARSDECVIVRRVCVFFKKSELLTSAMAALSTKVLSWMISSELPAMEIAPP